MDGNDYNIILAYRTNKEAVATAADKIESNRAKDALELDPEFELGLVKG